jgi:Ras-related protein Rab-8A
MQNAAENVNRILVGNKCDVDAGERRVSPEQGKALADEFRIKFFETSAKLNTNVDNAFMSIAKDIVGRLKINPEHYGSESSLKVKEADKKQSEAAKGGCC